MSSNDHITLFLTVISIVGTIGNLVVAFVYFKKRDKQTSTFFILMLAFIDFTVCCLLVPLTIFMESILFETGNIYLCKAFFFLTTTTVPSSSFLMVAIAFDRYFCICMANNRNLLTLSKSKVVGLILLIISACLGILPALASNTQQNNNKNNSTTNNIVSLTKNNSNDDAETLRSFNYNASSNYGLINFNGSLNVCFVDHDSSSKFGFLIMPFKVFYDFIFVASVFIITVLYVLIYKEIYTRRKAKRIRREELFYNKLMHGGGADIDNTDLILEENKNALYKICFCFNKDANETNLKIPDEMNEMDLLGF